MQKMILLILALAGISSCANVYAQEATAPATPEVKVEAPADPAAPAVKVNGTVITEGMIEQAVTQQLASRSKAPQNPELIERYKKIMRPRVIDNLINIELISQAAKKDGLALTDADIDARLEDLVKLAMEQSSMTREELAQDILKRQGVTIEESLANYRTNKQFLETILLEKIAAVRFAQQIEVSDQEIQNYYDENKAARYTKQEMVKASHILVKTIDDEGQPIAEEQKAQALTKIKEIKAKVDSEGSDFAALAGEFSDCPSGKRSGGDLGFFPKTGAMVEPFASEAFALKPGQVSDIVETQFGYHIIKCTDYQKEEVTPLSEVKDEISNQLARGKKNQVLSEMTSQLRSEAKIEYVNLADDPAEIARQKAAQQEAAQKEAQQAESTVEQK